MSDVIAENETLFTGIDSHNGFLASLSRKGKEDSRAQTLRSFPRRNGNEARAHVLAYAVRAHMSSSHGINITTSENAKLRAGIEAHTWALAYTQCADDIERNMPCDLMRGATSSAVSKVQ